MKRVRDRSRVELLMRTYPGARCDFGLYEGRVLGGFGVYFLLGHFFIFLFFVVLLCV